MIRNVLVIMRGLIVAQVIGFAALPILTRCFAPEAFGHYQLFISVLTLLLVFTTGRYEVALLRARGARELRALAQLCVMICLAVSLFVGLIGYGLIFTGWPSWLSTMPFPMWLIVAATLVGGLAQALTVLVTRERRYSANANSKILQSVGYAGTGLSIGAVNPVPWGLAAADFSGRLVNAVFLITWCRRHLPSVWKPAPLSNLKWVAHRYREYPLISVPGTVVNVLGGIVTPIMIYASFNANYSGQYGLFERSINLPIALITVSLSQVFTAQFSADLRQSADSAFTYFRQTLIYAAGLAMLCLIGVTLTAPLIFSVIFGPDWTLAGELAQLMAPALASALISGPLNMILTVMGHQKIQTAWELSRLGLVVGLWFAVQNYHLPLQYAVGGYSAVITLCNVAFVALSWAMLRRRLSCKRAATLSSGEA